MRAGALPTIELHHPGLTPMQECEAVARVLYAAAAKQNRNASANALAGLSPDDFDPGY